MTELFCTDKKKKEQHYSLGRSLFFLTDILSTQETTLKDELFW